MTGIELDARTGGVALALGYLAILGVLYRDPAGGLAAATASGPAFLLFLAFPVGGLLAGVYAVLDGPYGAVGLFLGANYLAVFGLVLAFGLVSVSLAVSALGVAVFALSLVASVVGLRAVVEWFGIERPSDPPAES